MGFPEISELKLPIPNNAIFTAIFCDADLCSFLPLCMMSHQDRRDESLPLLEDNIERPNYQSGRINISSNASSSSSTEDGSQQTAGNDNKAIDMATLVARRLSGASLYSILFG